MKKFLILMMLLSVPAYAEDYSRHQEIYFVNQAGGVVALTVEPCTIELAKVKGFDSRTYATESNGTKHEGCWVAPDISDAPQYPGVKIIPIVNVWYDGVITPFEQSLFKPVEKQERAL